MKDLLDSLLQIDWFFLYPLNAIQYVKSGILSSGKYNLTSLKTITINASKLDARIEESLRNSLPLVPIGNGYGNV